MSGSVNKVILVGNLGADPETRYTPNGGAITTIKVATSESWKDKQTGEWKESRYWYKDELENLIELLKQAMAYAGDRTEHESQGSKSGPGHNVVRELTTEELDDLPW